MKLDIMFNDLKDYMEGFKNEIDFDNKRSLMFIKSHLENYVKDIYNFINEIEIKLNK